ncbi:hypothetical protein M758_UG339200 [Ceratodon purpureus]|nr:hypothetical protein M758_UG339200 [Ceratodon purpureus]
MMQSSLRSTSTYTACESPFMTSRHRSRNHRFKQHVTSQFCVLEEARESSGGSVLTRHARWASGPRPSLHPFAPRLCKTTTTLLATIDKQPKHRQPYPRPFIELHADTCAATCQGHIRVHPAKVQKCENGSKILYRVSKCENSSR